MKGLSGRPGMVAGLLLLIVLVAVPVRVANEARSELAAAKAAAEAGDQTVAIDHFRRTLRWSLPFAHWDEQAVEGLESIARQREAAGDFEGALLAWRSIVGGLASSRTMFGSESKPVKRAKNQIARLAVDEDDAGRYRALLDREIAPDPLGGALLVLGFFGWVVSLGLLIRYGFDHLGRPQFRSARGPLIGALAGFASFVIGLFFA